MAEMTFVLYDLSGKRYELREVVSFEIQKDADAPCDALRLTYCDGIFPEIERAEAFLRGEKIFTGFCDLQKDGENSSFIYARSSACLLLDNEAQPLTYVKPNSDSLFALNAREFGFLNALPKRSSEYNYAVSKGTSRYGAINDFMKAETGKNIRVNAENELFIPQGKGRLLIDGGEIVSEERRINRGSAISEISYKLASSENYCRKIRSSFAAERKIRRERLRNLAGVPPWQKEKLLLNALASSAADYESYILELSACKNAELYDRAEYQSDSFGRVEGNISSVLITDKKTCLEIRKDNDLEAIRYVDK